MDSCVLLKTNSANFAVSDPFSNRFYETTVQNVITSTLENFVVIWRANHNWSLELLRSLAVLFLLLDSAVHSLCLD